MRWYIFCRGIFDFRKKKGQKTTSEFWKKHITYSVFLRRTKFSVTSVIGFCNYTLLYNREKHIYRLLNNYKSAVLNSRIHTLWMVN